VVWIHMTQNRGVSIVLSKYARHLKIYQSKILHVPTLNGTSFTSTSEVLTSAILKLLKIRD
jgi:hypothetical protein